MKVVGTLLAILLTLSGWMLIQEFSDTPTKDTVDDTQESVVAEKQRQPRRQFSGTTGRVSGHNAPAQGLTMRAVPLPEARIEASANAMELLPPDTSAVFWTDNYQDILDQVDAYTLLDQYRPKLQELDDELVKIGLTIDDFLTIENIGLDSAAPSALAFAGQSSSSTMVMVWRIQDIERLKDVLIPIAESAVGTYVPESLGEAQIIYLEKNKDTAFMLHRGHLFFLASIGWQANVDAVAAQIAYQEPGSGLSSTEVWADAQVELTDASAWGLVNVPAIHARISQEFTETHNPRTGLGHEPTEYELERQKKREEERAHQQVLVDSLLGSIKAIVGGLQLRGETISGDLNILTQDGSLVQRMLQNRHSVSPLQRALDIVPSVLFETKVNTATLRELVGLAAAAIGAADDLQRGLKLAKATVGLSGDVFDVFDGEIGVSWNRKIKDETYRFDAISVTAGLAKPQEAQRALSVIATLGHLAEVATHNSDTGGLTFNDLANGSFEIFVEGNTLVITNQNELIGRFAGGGQRLAHVLENADAARIVSDTNTCGAAMIDLPNLVEAEYNGFYDFSWAYEENESDVELARLEKRMTELRRKLYDNNQTEYKDEHSYLRAALETLSTIAMNTRLDGAAIRIHASLLHTAGSTAELVSELVTEGANLHERNEQRYKITQRLNQELSELQRQLHDVRNSK
jgi:hypothetical protein